MKPARRVASALAWKFNERALAPITGLVLTYDLEEFTSFLMVPDIQQAATLYLNFIDEQVHCVFNGSMPQFASRVPDLNHRELFRKVGTPIHRKFLGDGAMFIFDVTAMSPRERDLLVKAACIRSWDLKNYFHLLNEAAREFMPVHDMPKNIRFGVTYGTIHELKRSDGESEFIGFPINLATRLQKYAGAASFLASARLPLSHDWFTELGFVKVRPTRLRNRNNDYVYIDQNDLRSAPSDMFEDVLDVPPTSATGATDTPSAPLATVLANKD